MPTTADNVAAYILGKLGSTTAVKLQKLLYYSQAWSLVWDEAPLFEDRIEAWANGPVVPAIYRTHRGQYAVSGWPRGNAAELTSVQRETVDRVVEFYGHRDAQWLSDLTHMEDPWRKARAGLPVGAHGEIEITHLSMATYYSSISPS